ncbi:pre-B-cell leukemia homeobox interacting protein 1b isoform X2 [Electrophorus electricus]|uniref:pre-B-cell leukemia homeobox interacting protein 1b isoform X2 n=1 Tax=Electrophorus electricus TaxID=8005 RepID=UPI0015CFAAB8|nr:pre-B-cell leukemia homeobox interacting protein 1b isoform X2 [Electrophorus electricus]
MSDNSSGTNSWTFLTSEVKESGLEAQGQGDSTGSAKLPSEQLGPGSTRRPELPDSHAEETPGPEPPQVRPLEAGEDVAPLTADPLLSAGSPVESLSSLTSDSSERSPSHHGEGHHLPDPDGETFSDSFEPTSPAPDHDAATCGEISQEVEKSELRRTLSEESKLGCETEEKVSEGSGVRRRNISLLTPHRDDEDEELLEEHFQPPPRADGFGVSLNKCIFGALLLLALGTVFFSGVLMDLDGVGDVDVGDLTEAVLQKEWLNPDAPTETPAAVQHSELLERLAKDSEQIANLQARLQQQEERLRAAQFQVEEESKERKRREELEVENQRMKEELERLLALQKQLEQETQRLKKVSEGPEEDLQGLPAMQKALEVLRNMADISQNKKAPVVPSAEGEARAHHRGKEPEDARVQEKEQKNELKKARKGKVEVEKPRVQRGGEKRNGKKRGEQEKEEGKGEGKAEREKTRGKMADEGKGWKEGGEKRKFKHDGGKGDRKDGRKEKLGAVDNGRKGPGNKVKEDEEWKHGSEEKGWKHRKEWKKVNEAGGNEWKEQREGKKSEKREQEGGEKRGGGRKENLKDGGKPDKVQKEKLGKGKKDHHKGNGEKVQKDWEEKHRNVREQDWTGEAWTDVKRSKDEHHQKGQKWSRKDKPGHGSLDKASHHSHHIHDDYWTRQRDRIRHYRGSMEGCTGIMACAHAEGLNPVSQNEFESLFLGYLSRVLGTTEQASKKGELNKLVGEFFTDGVFVHDQIPFSEFVEDMADILEDVAEDEGNEEMEDEMEGFAREAMEKFALPDRRGNVEKRKGVSG